MVARTIGQRVNGSLSFTVDLAAEADLLRTFEDYSRATRAILREHLNEDIAQLRDAHSLAAGGGSADAAAALCVILQRMQNRLELLSEADEYGSD